MENCLESKIPSDVSCNLVPTFMDSRLKPESWCCALVVEWVWKQEDWNRLKLSDVPSNFLKHDINGHALLKLNREDLTKLGITKLGPLVRMYASINGLDSSKKILN